jgi:hypothetical protein
MWGGVMPLPGKEAALAFAPGGALFAATSAGLWKLTAKVFDHVHNSEYSQPALVIDAQGRPHVVFRKDGKIVYGDVAVDDGERPTLALAADGTLHLAYLSQGAIRLRSRKGDAWTEAETLSVRGPSVPALANGTDGVRLTYLGAAEKGPDALWLVRLPDKQPVLMPSLAGNVTNVNFLLHFGLRGTRWHYRPHDVWVGVNGGIVAKFADMIPEGRFLFELNPSQVSTSTGRPVPNRVSLRTWHVNGGHYSMAGDFQFVTRTAWSEWFAFADTEAEVRQSLLNRPGLNLDRPDLAVLANSLNLPSEPPRDGNTTFSITVANLGEAASAPAQLALFTGEKRLASAAVPPLKSGERHIASLRLEGRVASVTFKLEQEKPDFDPSNDTLTLQLWSEKDPELTATPVASAVQTVTDDITLEKYRDQVGKTLVFVVTGRNDGRIWGTDVYTDDSSLGTAAVHAGVLRVGERKQVRVTILPGQTSYQGSTRNGVTTGDWESWAGSYQFEGARSDTPVALDLRTWKREGPAGHGVWDVAPDSKSVVQQFHGNPTFFVSPDAYSSATLRGKVRVEPDGGQHYIGLVLGYQAPLAAKKHPEYQFQFLLFDWKHEADNGSGGFSLVRVQGDFKERDRRIPGFTDHKSTPEFEVLASKRGKGAGWKENVEYSFEVRYDTNQIRISIDGKSVFDVKGTFPAGRIGLHTFGQKHVRFSQLSIQGEPVAKLTGGGMPLREWRQQGPAANGKWVLSRDGTDVVQTEWSKPTFFVSPDDHINTTIKCKILVPAPGASELHWWGSAGLVFGYRSPLVEKGDKEGQFEFLLLSWSGLNPLGDDLYLYRVKGAFDKGYDGLKVSKSIPECEVLAAIGGVNSSHYERGQEHTFELCYEKERVRISVDDKPIFDVKGKFAPGRFGFYSFFQRNIHYYGFTAEPVK